MTNQHKKTSRRYSPEVRERAVRLLFDHVSEHTSQWATIKSIASKIGCPAQTLHTRVKQAERDQGLKPGPTSEERERLKALERENRELRQANEILRKRSSTAGPRHDQLCRCVPVRVRGHVRDVLAHWADLPSSADRPVDLSLSCTPSRKPGYGTAPRQTRRGSGARDSDVFDENSGVYGVRKVCRQLLREGIVLVRCTVERLMKTMGLQGVIRGKRVRKTVPVKPAPCPLDHVNRQFKASRPNVLWVSDFTYVSTWAGFVYVAFVIDAYARGIMLEACLRHDGWRVSRTAHAGFVLDALEQASHDRKPLSDDGLVHHSDRGVQYVSIKYTDRLAETGLVPSVGSVGDSYDNALAETINGLYKTEVIYRRGPWRTMEAVAFATLEWVDWFNNRRLLSSIGNVPPAEAEANYYASLEELKTAA